MKSNELYKLMGINPLTFTLSHGKVQLYPISIKEGESVVMMSQKRQIEYVADLLGIEYDTLISEISLPMLSLILRYLITGKTDAT